MTLPLDLSKSRRLWMAACNEAGIGEDDRRAIQLRVCGKVSAKQMGVRDFNRCILDIKERGLWTPKAKAPKRAGSRPLAGDPQSAKIRALWLALYHLGEVRSPEERALAAFVQRHTKVSALQFLTVHQASRVIEILKSWCARVGYLAEDVSPRTAKVTLVLTLWRRLTDLGAVQYPDLAGLEHWLTCIAPPVAVLAELTEDQLDAAIERLGAWVRRAKPKADKAERKAP